GNRNWMVARESQLVSDLFGAKALDRAGGGLGHGLLLMGDGGGRRARPSGGNTGTVLPNLIVRNLI
ncbi:hypothetical protein ACWD4N_48180, partial [Streptomyces sp. NPDC002586]